MRDELTVESPQEPKSPVFRLAGKRRWDTVLYCTVPTRTVPNASTPTVSGFTLSHLQYHLEPHEKVRLRSQGHNLSTALLGNISQHPELKRPKWLMYGSTIPRPFL
jgi:hypothetical protein